MFSTAPNVGQRFATVNLAWLSVRPTERAAYFFLHAGCDLGHLGRMKALPTEEVQRAVRLALAEDIGKGDVTTLALVSKTAKARAAMVAHERIVVAGLSVAEAVFRELTPKVQIGRCVEEGARVELGQALMHVTGLARAVLSGERVALNFVQRMSGIATLTAEFVEVVRGTGAKILDTRKTTPGLRSLEKYAVTCGGGHNHRHGLSEMILIKDNHLAALRHASPNPIAQAVERAREKYPKLSIEVETDTLEQVAQAAEAGADIILLDNMDLKHLRAAVRLVGGRARTEASGGVNLSNVRAIAETGVDFISVGALTHSARAMDIGLDFER
jgi:nicotinate-nucleotide pyrophosphorylase (carboxylating)